MKEKIKFQSKNIVSVEEDSREIFDIAEKRGIQVPSTHLGFFKTIYAKIEEPNLNGIRLAEKAVHDALPGLVGSQVNFEHMGAGFLCGTILETWINDSDEIEVVYSFFKSIYPDEYEESVELAKEGDLAVSFELLAERDSQQWLEDGTVRLNEIDFQGMGHLMANPPACPQAKIYEFATRCKERLSTVQDRGLVFASQIEEQCDLILNADKWTTDISNNFPDSSFAVIEPAYTESGEKKLRHLAFKDRDGNLDLTNYRIALDKVDEILPVTDSISTEELRKQAREELDKHKDVLIANQNKNNSNQGGTAKVEMTEDQKKKIEELRAELGDFAKEIKDEDLLDDSVVAELRKEFEASKEEELAEEIPAEEPKAEEPEVEEEPKAEETPAEEEAPTEEEEPAEEESKEEEEEAPTEEEPEAESPKEEANAEEQSEETAFKQDMVEIRTFSLEEVDGVETIVESIDRITVTDWEIMQEAKAQVEELQKSLEAKESEISAIRENAEIIATRKIELKDNQFAKDFTDEDFLNKEKVTKAIQDKENAELVEKRKEELKENEYAKNFTNEDYLNDDKIELAKTKKENDELKANKEEVVASTQEDTTDMNTGDASETDSKYESVMASYREAKKKEYTTQKVYTRKNN